MIIARRNCIAMHVPIIRLKYKAILWQYHLDWYRSYPQTLMPLSEQALMSEQLGFGYGESKEHGLDYFFCFPRPYPYLHNYLITRRVLRDSMMLPSFLYLSPFTLPVLQCVVVAVDGLMEVRKVHMQFFQAPELHVAHQRTRREEL